MGRQWNWNGNCDRDASYTEIHRMVLKTRSLHREKERLLKKNEELQQKIQILKEIENNYRRRNELVKEALKVVESKRDLLETLKSTLQQLILQEQESFNLLKRAMPLPMELLMDIEASRVTVEKMEEELMKLEERGEQLKEEIANIGESNFESHMFNI